MKILEGDIIQITDPEDNWFPALLVVDEVKSWGVQAYLHYVHNDGTPTGLAYYRISDGSFTKVGRAIVIDY